MSTFATATTTLASTSSPPSSSNPLTIPTIIFLVLIVLIIGAMIGYILTFCRGSASEITSDLEKNSIDEKDLTHKNIYLLGSIRGLKITKMPRNILDIFPFNINDLIPSRPPPIFDKNTGLLTSPHFFSSFIPLQPLRITEATLESSDSYTDDLILNFPLPPSIPPPPSVPNSRPFAATRLELAAAFSPIPILQFTPPTPRKVKTGSIRHQVIYKDTLHPVYGPIKSNYISKPRFSTLPSEPSSAFRF